MEQAEHKKRVVFMSTHDGIGGVRNLWEDLAAAFSDKGLPTTLVALYPGIESDAEIATPKWFTISDRRPRGPVQAIRAVFHLWVYLRKNRPSAVFTSMPAANAIVPIVTRLALPRCRVMTSHHGPITSYSRPFAVLDGLVGATEMVNAIVCTSEAVKSSLENRSLSYKSKITVIKNALPKHIEAEIARLKRDGRDGDRERLGIVSVGRLAPQKNYPALLRAVALLPRSKLTLVGSGPDEPTLRKLAGDLSIADRVAFIGHRPRIEVLNLLASSQVFALPSLYEGNSIAVIEAAKLGVPIVVSDVPTQVEAVTRADGTLCAVIVPPDNAAQLAEKLSEILDSPTVARKYSRLSKSLGEEITFENLLSSYLQLAEKSEH